MSKGNYYVTVILFDFIELTEIHLMQSQEYVIVLLRNGKRKEQARNELNVFLGDDSDSFVSW